jgi:hypothetical protein
MSERQFARGTGMTGISGLSGAFCRQYSEPHNKTPHCTLERLFLPTNGARAVFAAGCPRAARHYKHTQSGALVFLAHELLMLRPE